MLSVHRFQATVCGRRLFSLNNPGKVRQIVFTGSKWGSRTGSSRLQPRKVEFTPADLNKVPEGNARLLGPVLFTAGVLYLIFLKIKLLTVLYADF